MNGIISEKNDPRDFRFGMEIEFPKLPKSFKDFKIQYNQKEISDNCCTVTACMTAISNLTGLSFTLDNRKEIWDKAKELGASDINGWYIIDAVKLVTQWVKDNWKKEFIFVSVFLKDSDFMKAVQAGYPVVTGFGGSGVYGEDIKDNGIINGTYTGNPTYNHCISLWGDNGKVDVVDHYPQRGSSNVYTFENWEKTRKEVFFNTGYVIMPKNEELEVLIDQKLTLRFEGKFIMNVKNGEIALVTGGKRVSLNEYLLTKGRELLISSKLVTGMTEENFLKIGSK